MLVVAGYGGIARPHLDVIARDYPDLWVKAFDYGLRSEDGTITGLRKAPIAAAAEPTAPVRSAEAVPGSVSPVG
jgi:hypothetical protein